MFPLNSQDQYIDENGNRSSLSKLFEGAEHDIEELEETVEGHTTAIGTLQTKTGALQDQISTDEYSTESGYTAGDYVIHANKLYKCNTTCTADTWANNSEYFTETSVSDEIAALNEKYIVFDIPITSSPVTLNTNDYGLYTGTLGKTGYAPMGVVGISLSGTGSGRICISSYNVSLQNDTVSVILMNTSNINISFEIVAKVLFRKIV